MEKNQIINNFINEEIIDIENINILSNLKNKNLFLKENGKYNLFETFKIIFDIILTYNKDFYQFKESISDEILRNE